MLSGQDFVKRLRAVKFTDRVQPVKLDLTDFYLEGEHPVLLALIGKGRDLLDKCFYEAVQILLEEQYACVSELDPLNLDIHQIIKGIGQGLLHAGDLADYLWYLAVEHGWAMHQGIQAANGILGFFRFRDDMIIFMNGGEHG